MFFFQTLFSESGFSENGWFSFKRVFFFEMSPFFQEIFFFKGFFFAEGLCFVKGCFFSELFFKKKNVFFRLFFQRFSQGFLKSCFFFLRSFFCQIFFLHVFFLSIFLQSFCSSSEGFFFCFTIFSSDVYFFFFECFFKVFCFYCKGFLLTDFLVIVLIDFVIGLIMLIIIKSGLVSFSYHVMKVNDVLLPELNQGPADLQSAALTTGLSTLEILITIVEDEA